MIFVFTCSGNSSTGDTFLCLSKLERDSHDEYCRECTSEVVSVKVEVGGIFLGQFYIFPVVMVQLYLRNQLRISLNIHLSGCQTFMDSH